MKTTITFELDTDRLDGYTDQYLAALWHIGQANPAPFGDVKACSFAEHVGREIVQRFLALAGAELWHHQGRHIKQVERQQASNPTASEIDTYLRGKVPQGAFVTIPELVLALGAKPDKSGNTLEGQLHAALRRCQFTPSRESTGERRRGFVAPQFEYSNPSTEGGAA